MSGFSSRRGIVLLLAFVAAVAGGSAGSLLGICGPFTDVAADAFCPFVLEIFYLGITTGTTPTTFDPAANVSRLQMAAFLSRSVDGVLKRGARRGALQQWWTSKSPLVLGTTTLGQLPLLVQSDGADIWACGVNQGEVYRVRGSDGKLLETWTGAPGAFAPLVAMGRIFITAPTTNVNPGKLYRIDPRQSAGAVTIVATDLGPLPEGIAFDGERIWTANGADLSSGGSVSILTPSAFPGTFSVSTITAGFQAPVGLVFDGANVWTTDNPAGKLLKLDSGGTILHTVTVGAKPSIPALKEDAHGIHAHGWPLWPLAARG